MSDENTPTEETPGEDNSQIVEKLILNLKRERDELALKIHLGKEDLKDEWQKLDDKFAQLSSDYDPAKKAVAETADEVWQSLKLVGSELKDGFKRIRDAL